ncbi:nickel-binding protein [Gillisia limnaea]|uniref:Transcriptional regulator, AraC family n=1 Tax=Gillisia limnaea (strain DSM 15749 / LMG 21470 / R-8282) TaxID=865937 RepID=H2BVQ6_GILLR|nr:nickel-binding protein [Gillisia limnaea]EHQ04012.1 transcriptional regulator, AraC family [Gillisia limnaea DSM 15749]
MPIYMDRHDVSKEVTAEIVADLHQKDLKIQHKFNCKGLTYWFDEKRKTAFCLVEAPNKAAIKEMHDYAHGEVPNRIIEVDHAVVESFLGRIEDPEKSQKTKLNIINDPAFRTIMVVGVKPFSLKENLDKSLNTIVDGVNRAIVSTIELYKGRLVKQNPDHFLISFDSVTNAVVCALKIRTEFEENFGRKYSSHIELNIGLNAGVPVEEKEGIFENTIKAAHSYFDLVKGIVVISSEVKDLYESENLNTPLAQDSVVALNPAEEHFLKELLDFTESEWSNTSLSIDDFCRYLGYSKSRLYRKIVTVTGKSANSFLKVYRLNRSLNLLNKKDMNISEIAFETGFNSPAYFSKCFHQTFGILPSQYIK